MTMMTMFAHIFANLDWKTIAVLIGLAILVYGLFLGPKRKDYDKKEKSEIRHDLRKAEGGKDYIYKGSGMYRDSKGNVKNEQSTNKKK
ncbi:MAG: hypothetical protein NC432_06235 [Roseburia sp.]|nr:hypothetical protein [Roseburia sp.]MCM1097644.1 hypothetical protein [Ruminococcus flavefaciens]